MTWLSDLILAAILTGLIELMLHWLPWRLLLQRDLPRTIAYVLGVLGLLGPLSWLFYTWEYLQALEALWVVVITGGLAVHFGYGVDLLGVELARRKEAEERERALAERIKHLQEKEHGAPER